MTTLEHCAIGTKDLLYLLNLLGYLFPFLRELFAAVAIGCTQPQGQAVALQLRNRRFYF